MAVESKSLHSISNKSFGSLLNCGEPVFLLEGKIFVCRNTIIKIFYVSLQVLNQ